MSPFTFLLMTYRPFYFCFIAYGFLFLFFFFQYLKFSKAFTPENSRKNTFFFFFVYGNPPMNSLLVGYQFQNAPANYQRMPSKQKLISDIDQHKLRQLLRKQPIKAVSMRRHSDSFSNNILPRNQYGGW